MDAAKLKRAYKRYQEALGGLNKEEKKRKHKLMKRRWAYNKRLSPEAWAAKCGRLARRILRGNPKSKRKAPDEVASSVKRKRKYSR